MDDKWLEYLQQLHAYVHQQDTRIKQCESLIQQLKNEVAALKKQPMVIERIEYNIDQLKVETLEGTLNIGLNPLNESADIEEFEVANRKLHIQPNEYANPTIEQDIHEEVLIYLESEGQERIHELEQQYQVQLNDHYREMMVDDIRKQLQPRIPYYFSNMQKNSDLMNNPDLLHQTIIEKMKEDINQAFIAFIQHFPKQQKEVF